MQIFRSNNPLEYKAYNSVIGLNIETTSNTTLTIKAGICMDSTKGQNIEIAEDILLDAEYTGINAIDTGALEASTKYYIYVISPTNDFTKPVGVILTKTLNEPLLPMGYSVIKLIGLAWTDSSSHFVSYVQTGYGNDKEYFFNSPIGIITTGSASSYANVDLATYLPKIKTTAKISIETGGTSGSASVALFNSSTAFLNVVRASEIIQVELPVELISTTGVGFKYKVSGDFVANISLQSFVHAL